MRRSVKGLAALALMTTGVAIAASDVHVCVAADGSVTYTNMPCRNGSQQAAPTPRPIHEPDTPVAAAPTPEPQLPTVVLRPKPAPRSAARVPPGATDSEACRAARAAYRAAPRDTFSDGYEVKRRLDRVHDTCAGNTPAAGAFDASTGEFYMLQGDQLVEPAQGQQLVR